jgi:hypothetical protein
MGVPVDRQKNHDSIGESDESNFARPECLFNSTENER